MTRGAPEPVDGSRAEAIRAFGRYLLRERELRGLAPEDVARVTRLAAGVIDAIESGDPERMPPRGYLVGYLRSYAGAVGLDADDVVLRYQEAAGAEEAELAPGATVPGTRPGGVPAPRRRRRWLALVALLAVLVAVAVAIGMRRGAGSGEIRGRKSGERAPYRAPGTP